MKINALNSKISVSDQLVPEDLAQLKALGYSTVINNRPDNEGEGQPDSASLEKAATLLGMKYVHLPVRGLAIQDSDVDQFAEAMKGDSGQILAFCRTGMRSIRLWALSGPDNLPWETVVQIASDAGYDIAALRR